MWGQCILALYDSDKNLIGTATQTFIALSWTKTRSSKAGELADHFTGRQVQGHRCVSSRQQRNGFTPIQEQGDDSVGSPPDLVGTSNSRPLSHEVIPTRRRPVQGVRHTAKEQLLNLTVAALVWLIPAPQYSFKATPEISGNRVNLLTSPETPCPLFWPLLADKPSSNWKRPDKLDQREPKEQCYGCFSAPATGRSTLHSVRQRFGMMNGNDDQMG